MPVISPAFKIKDFRLLFFTRLFGTMGLQAQAVIVGWQVYQLRPDPLLLGLVGLTEAIPAITCSFFSGHIVDTNRAALVYRISVLALFLNTCLIFSAVAPFIPFSNDQRLILLFVGVFISGASRSFSSPAVFTLIPQIVPKDLISSAVAWNSSTFQFAAILGPSLGGLLYGSFGAVTAFLFPSALLALSLLFSLFFSSETNAFRNPSRREPFAKSLRTGIDFTLKHKVLLSTMLLDMFSVLFGGAVAVLPMFADQVLHTAAFGLGLLRAAPSVGSAIIAITLAVRPLKTVTGRSLLWVVAGFGACMIAFGLSRNFALSLFLLALSGAFDGVNMVIRSTILQLLTPSGMRGRVSALSSIFITSSNEIGAFESGLAARLLRLVPSVVFGGIMTLFIVGAVSWRVPELRQTEIGKDTPLPD